MNINKIMFLDIDGCLTSEIDGNYFNPDPTRYHPSKRIVDYILDFCKKENVELLSFKTKEKGWIDPYIKYDK